jgi:hypothetical protein
LKACSVTNNTNYIYILLSPTLFENPQINENLRFIRAKKILMKIILGFETCFMLTTVSIVGTLGNSLACLVYLTKRNITKTNIMILALAATDLITSIVLVPLTIYMELNEFATESILLCKSYHFFNTTIVPASCLLMTIIAFDRLFSICYPHLRVITKSRALRLIAFVFIIGSLMGIIPSLAVNIKYDVTTNVTTCGFQFIIISKNTFFASRYLYNSIYIFSAITITILNSIIYANIYKRRKEKLNQKIILARALVSYSKKKNLGSKNRQTGNQCLKENNLLNGTNSNMTSLSRFKVKDVRTALMLFTVSALFIITYFPAILMTYEVIQFNFLVFFLYFTSTAINPIIYCFMNPCFRKDLYNSFKRSFIRSSVY